MPASAVTETPTAAAVGRAAINFPATATASMRARQVLDGFIREHALAVNVDDAHLVLTELVTNACQAVAANEPVTLMLDVHDAGLFITVIDTSSAEPVLHDDPLAEHGRGLRLIDALSSSWGWDFLPDGRKRVHASLGWDTSPAINGKDSAMTEDQADTYRQLRLSAVNVLLADPESITDVLKTELYELRTQLARPGLD